jgi:predicted lipoprotein with Yx(FWY)xxD motif
MRRTIATALLAATLALAACGSDDDEASTDAADTTAPAEDAAADAAGSALASLVGTADTELGEVLTDAEGYTLYGFTPDEGGTPTCTDACAEAWPPVLVEGSELPEGLDAETYSVVERPDGEYQLAANDWPLYSYASDGAEGDVTGQGVGDSWYAMGADGHLLREGAASGGGSDTTEEPADSGGGY